jgi:hypothetical protein
MALSRDQCIVLGLAAVIGAAGIAAYVRSGGGSAPKSQFTEGLWNTAAPFIPVQPQVGDGYRWTAHKYPNRVGHEITTLIQGGHSVASVPRVRGYEWIVNPPSEATI